MQLAANGLKAHASKGLRPLYAIHGDEPLLQIEAADTLREAARSLGFTERSVFTVQGAHFDWAAVINAAQSMGLFADKQIIDLRIPSGKPGKEGSAALQTLAELSKDNDSTLLIVTLPKLDRATMNSAWFAALDSFGVSVKVDPVERHALPAWIAQRLAAQNQRVAAGEDGQRALQFFAERVEGNLLAAHQEVQKLALLHPEGELSLEQIEAAVMNVARYDVFKLSDTVLSGNQSRTQKMIDGLNAEGEAAVLVHWSLSEDIRGMKRVFDAVNGAFGGGKPIGVVLKEQRVWGNKERAFERIIPRLQAAHINKLLQSAHEVDGVVKGLKLDHWPTDPWQALQRLASMLVRVCGR